jgi:hypothetical protein
MPEIEERISRGSPYAWSQDPAVKYPDAWVVSATGMVIHLTGIRASSLTQAFRGHERATPQNNWCVGESRLQKIEDFSPPHGARILWKGLGVFPESPGNFDWERYLSTPGTDCPMVLVWANQSWRVAKLLSYNPAQKTVWTSVHGFMIPLLFKAKDVFPLLLPEGMGVSVEQVLDRAEELKAFVPGRKAQVALADSSHYGKTGEVGDVIKFDGLPRSVGLRGLPGFPKGSLAWFSVEELRLLPESPEVPKAEEAPPAEAPAPLEDTVDFPEKPAFGPGVKVRITGGPHHRLTGKEGVIKCQTEHWTDDSPWWTVGGFGDSEIGDGWAFRESEMEIVRESPPEPAPKPVPTPLSIGDRVEIKAHVMPKAIQRTAKVVSIVKPDDIVQKEAYKLHFEGISVPCSFPFSREDLTLLMPESMVEAPEQPSSNPGELPPEKPRYRAPAPGEDLTGKSIRMTTSQTKGEVVGRWESPIKEKVWKVQSQYGETRPVHQKFLEVEDVEPSPEIAKVLSAAAGELRVEEVENPPKINDLQAGVLIGVGDWLSAMPGRSVKITWDAEAQRFIFGIRDVDGTGMDTDYGRVCREAVPVLINAMMDVSRLNQASGLEPIPDGTWHSIGGPTP